MNSFIHRANSSICYKLYYGKVLVHTLTTNSDLQLNLLFCYFMPPIIIMHETVYLLCLVPHSDITQILFWTSGKVKLEGKAEHIVNTAEEVQTAFHLRLDLEHKQKKEYSWCLSWFNKRKHSLLLSRKGVKHSWCCHLLHCAENVGVILLEAPHSGQAGQGSWQFVPVEDPKVCQPQRKLPPRARPVAVHQTKGQPQRRKSGKCNMYKI